MHFESYLLSDFVKFKVDFDGPLRPGVMVRQPLGYTEREPRLGLVIAMTDEPRWVHMLWSPWIIRNRPPHGA